MVRLLIKAIPADLARDDEALAAAGHCPTEEFLGVAVTVDVSGVEEGDARV